MIAPTTTEPAPTHTDRPRSLDESDLRQLCVLVSRGCTIKQAARCLGYALRDIRHEHETNGGFRRKLALAKMKRDLAPLRAIHRAMKKDWRAAAWFLERTQPEKFGRRNHRAFTQKQANALVKDVTSIIGEESASKGKIDRTSSRVEAAIRYAFHAHSDMNRTAAELDRAMKHHDMKSPRYCPTLTDFSSIPPLASGASPNLPPRAPIPTTPNTKPNPTSPQTPATPTGRTIAGGTAHRPNVIDNLTGVARPIVGVAQPQEANRAAVTRPPSPQRGAS